DRGSDLPTSGTPTGPRAEQPGPCAADAKSSAKPDQVIGSGGRTTTEMRAVRPTGHLATFTETLNPRASIGSFPADGHGGPLRGGDFMMRNMLFGIAAGLMLASAGVR